MNLLQRNLMLLPILLVAAAAAGWAASNPDIAIAVASGVDGLDKIAKGQSSSYTATLHFPSGVANPGGVFAWSFVPDGGGAGGAVTIATTPSGSTTADSHSVTITGTAGGTGKIHVQWTAAKPNYDSPGQDKNLTIVQIIDIEPDNGRAYAVTGIEKFFTVKTKPASEWAGISVELLPAASAIIISAYNPATGKFSGKFTAGDSGATEITLKARKESYHEYSETMNVYGWKHQADYPKVENAKAGDAAGGPDIGDYKYCNLSTASGISCTYALRVYDGLPGGADSDLLAGITGSYKKTDMYVWGGPSGTEPAKSTYKLQFSGQGTATSVGVGTLGNALITGANADGSTAQSLAGAVSGDGGPNDTFSLANIGGSFSSSGTVALSGEKAEGETPSISGAISSSSTGNLVFTQAGTYSLLPMNSLREFAGSTATFTAQMTYTAGGSCSADGSVIFPSAALVTGICEASIGFTVVEPPKPSAE